jgi:gamma-glutamyltranspeptidase/glutathione hydrolase
MGWPAQKQTRLSSRALLGHIGPANAASDDRVFMRRTLALFAAAPLLFVGGCTATQSLGESMGSVFGFGSVPRGVASGDESSTPQKTGMTVADEPMAARAGARVLQEGGSAADAVTTMFFTLTATYPVAAGLGGGGICLVRDAGAAQVTEYDFLARAPSSGGPFAVPAAVNGFHDLQAGHGLLPWQRSVAPGEAYAAAGFPISQALSARLADAVNVVRLDAGLAAEFLDESGQPRPVGSVVKNPDLAQTLARVRLEGNDGFYKGVTATRIATYAAAQGGAISMAELAGVRSTQGPAAVRRIGGMTAWLPGPRTGAGAFAGSLLDNLARAQARGQTGETAVMTAAGQSLSAFGIASLPRDMGSTGFAAVDAKGQAVAFAVTLNGPFGSGRTATDTGMTLAASPAIGQNGLAGAFLTPLLAANGSDAALAGTGSGGPNGTAAAAYALLISAGGRLLNRATIRSTGAAPFDTVNMIACEEGICVALPDPGAHGQGAAPDPGVQAP